MKNLKISCRKPMTNVEFLWGMFEGWLALVGLITFLWILFTSMILGGWVEFIFNVLFKIRWWMRGL